MYIYASSLYAGMKNILFLFLLFICTNAAFGQTLKKYAIANSGCSAMFACNPGKFETSTSPDSSVVYTGECTSAGATYDLICVKLKESAPNPDIAEQVLEQYLDYLKSSYEVTEAAGYTKGLRLQKKETTRGILDSWKDKDNNYIKVKGWTNGRFIAVLMAISQKELPAAKINPFLDGIVFPGK